MTRVGTPVQIPLVAYATRPKYVPACEAFQLVCCGVWGVEVGVARRAKNSALHCFFNANQRPGWILREQKIIGTALG